MPRLPQISPTANRCRCRRRHWRISSDHAVWTFGAKHMAPYVPMQASCPLRDLRRSGTVRLVERSDRIDRSVGVSPCLRGELQANHVRCRGCCPLGWAPNQEDHRRRNRSGCLPVSWLPGFCTSQLPEETVPRAGVLNLPRPPGRRHVSGSVAGVSVKKLQAPQRPRAQVIDNGTGIGSGHWPGWGDCKA